MAFNSSRLVVLASGGTLPLWLCGTGVAGASGRGGRGVGRGGGGREVGEGSTVAYCSVYEYSLKAKVYSVHRISQLSTGDVHTRTL